MSDEKTRRILREVGRELKESPPSILAKTRRKKGAAAAEKQRVAILLSKARARSANVPPPPEGGGGVFLNPSADLSKSGWELMKELKVI